VHQGTLTNMANENTCGAFLAHILGAVIKLGLPMGEAQNRDVPLCHGVGVSHQQRWETASP
jgi:hypothetical protein